MNEYENKSRQKKMNIQMFNMQPTTKYNVNYGLPRMLCQNRISGSRFFHIILCPYFTYHLNIQKHYEHLFKSYKIRHQSVHCRSKTLQTLIKIYLGNYIEAKRIQVC